MTQKRIAQYKQIENDLLEKINLGYYQKDDMIPTELELSNTYHVSRVTVRRATDNLVARGLLSRIAGVGTSANLATTFAQAGKKVVLVDCDMRKGRLFSIFGVSPVPGLSNYLSGINHNGEASDNDIVNYIKSTEVENLYVLPAGSVPPNPSELLVSEMMANTMKQLEQLCDIVIYDGTPTNLVTDALIISRNVDTTLIVCAYKETKMDELEKVKNNIINVGGKIAGVVINKMPMQQKEYYS